jgi:hypothetical protein
LTPPGRSALILYSRWLSSRQLSVRVEFYPDFPNMPRMEEQFLARLDRTDMGSHVLSVGQALRFNLPGTSERAEISLRRNVPDEPARLNIGESSIRSVEIGDIIETRGDFRIELINRSKAGIYALAFGHGGGGGEEQSVGHLNEPLVAPGESYYGRLEAHLEYLVRSGMIPRRELD